MQTAIVIQYRGEEILVRLNGIHVPANQIDVDTREQTWYSWQPVDLDAVEVRLEGVSLPPSRPDVPSLDDVLAAVSYDEARTVQEISTMVVGERWEQRTTVRNRLDHLEELGLVIRDGSPARFIRPDVLAAHPIEPTTESSTP